MNWIIQNSEWVFSGIGVTVILTVLGWIFKKRNVNSQPSQSITSGNNSYNIQGGNDVKVKIGEKNDR